jgi:ABC-type phosphate transport system substrate-binding protein
MNRLLLVPLLFIGINAFAEVAVVVHPSNASTLNAEEISKLYLGRSKSFPDGKAAIPLALGDSSGATAIFNEKVLNKTGSQIKAYWSKLVFTGKGTPPKELATDQEVIDLVSQNPSVIGYVDKSAVNASVKVVATF